MSKNSDAWHSQDTKLQLHLMPVAMQYPRRETKAEIGPPDPESQKNPKSDRFGNW